MNEKEKVEPDNQQESQDTSSDANGLRKGHGRTMFPKHLPRHFIHHELKGSERQCDCCGSFMNHIGEQTSEQLEVIPAKVYVIQHIRHKYACKTCQDKVVIAKLLDQPIDKGKAAPGTLAEVLVNKYKDHLPLYRQSQRFARFGIHISRSTLCDWVMQSASLLSPLVDAMKERALIPSQHLFSDDTPIRTLRVNDGDTKTGRFWIYASKGRDKYPACTVYQYTPNRESGGPLSFLKDFKGYFQADAYAGYDRLFVNKNKNEIIEVGCWAHARRKFFEVAQLSKKEGLAHKALEYIRELYEIERKAKDVCSKVEDIHQWRQTHAPPILNSFHTWLKEQQKRVLPRTALAGAINYALNHWEALNSYLLDGNLEIDNNRSERGIRPLALGRKNYLFVVSKSGGEAAAIIYSLLTTCEQHGVNPWEYLQDVLTRLPTHPYSKIDDLLPYHWKASTKVISFDDLFLNRAA